MENLLKTQKAISEVEVEQLIKEKSKKAGERCHDLLCELAYQGYRPSP